MIENNTLCNPSPFDGSHRTGPVSLAGKAMAAGQAFLRLWDIPGTASISEIPAVWSGHSLVLLQKSKLLLQSM